MENKKEDILEETTVTVVENEINQEKTGLAEAINTSNEVIQEEDTQQQKEMTEETDSSKKEVATINIVEEKPSQETENSQTEVHEDEIIKCEDTENISDNSEDVNNHDSVIENENKDNSDINIKDSLIKATDQIKKSSIYAQVKEMFNKIKANDYDFSFSKRDQLVALGIVGAVILFDQITKIISANLLMEYESYEIIDNFFYFTFIYNPGMAWGTLEGMRWLFVFITPVILLFILHIFVYSKKHEVYTRAGMILVFAGAIGNWIDRLFIGEVRDFIHFIIPIINYDFPIFNIADIAVVVGMGLVVLEVIIQEYQIWKLSKSL